jgi:hypothetical protein
MEEQVKLWQLIKDWLEQQNNGWVLGVHGATYLIENDEWKFYIGDDYIAGYPSCGPNLIAADPEFFNKLTERMSHIWDCEKCIMMQSLERELRTDMVSQIKPMDIDFSGGNTASDYMALKVMLNSCYRTMGKPLPYPIIHIDP